MQIRPTQYHDVVHSEHQCSQRVYKCEYGIGTTHMFSIEVVGRYVVRWTWVCLNRKVYSLN
jgi:hypothetical protein